MKIKKQIVTVYFITIYFILTSQMFYAFQVIKEQEEYIATQYKEVIDLGQELRVTQEQMQNSHLELAEARRQEVQAQREIERLSSELEDIKQLSKEKVILF